MTNLAHQPLSDCENIFLADDNRSFFKKIWHMLKKNSLLKDLRLFYLTRVSEPLFWGRATNDFFRVFGGHILFQSLITAINLDLFNLLKKTGPPTCPN